MNKQTKRAMNMVLSFGPAPLKDVSAKAGDVAKKLHKATGRSVKSWLILEAHRKIAEYGNKSKKPAKIALANLLDFVEEDKQGDKHETK